MIYKKEFKTFIDNDLVTPQKQWLLWLEHQRKYSPHTLHAYEKDLYFFFEFMAKYKSTKITKEIVSNLAIRDFRAWMTKLKTQNSKEKSNSSVARALSVVRNFLRYVEKQHNIKNSAINNVRTPKAAKPLPKALTIEDSRDVFNEILEQDYTEIWVKKRDIALVYLLYGAGLRISEALNIKYKDFSANSNKLTVKGKGKKYRELPIIPKINNAICQYIESCPYNLEQAGFLFVGVQGKRLNAGVFQRQIRKVRGSLGLRDSVTPHAFRHSFATHLLSNGGDLRAIQELLGHENLSTTQRYTQIDTDRMLETYKDLHPRK